MLKTNLQRRQIVTILLVLFLFLFMVFTLVLARYLSERTEQEDASAQTGTGNTLTVCATGTVGQNGCQYVGGDGIQQAVDAAKSGDTVLLKAGTYRRTGYTSYSYNEDNPDHFYGAFLYIPGKSGRNLTLKGEGVVVLDGSTDKTVGRNGISIYEGTTTIENIKITGMHWTWCTGKNDPCGSDAIIVYRATANIINSTISQNGGDGIQFIESKGIISDNQLIQNGLQLQNVSPNTAIHTTSSSSVVISNNNIVENIGDGIVSINRSESIITNNIVERNGGAGVVVGYMDKTRIQNNRINNNNEEGIYLLSTSTSIVRNNILVGNKGAGIHVSNYSYATYPIILNNIITHTKKSDDSHYDGFGIMRGRWYEDTFTDDYNNYDSIAFNITFANAGEGTKCGKWEFCNSLHDDPKFVSESDFHLQPGSPGINAGDPNLKDSDGTRSDMGFYGGPNDCPGGDCSPNFIPFILNSSFEWGDYKSWFYGTGIDTSATQVHNCDQWGPCSDGKQYITLARKLDGDKTKADFSTHWIATGQNLSGRTIRVKFNAKAHSVSSVHQPPPSLEGLFIQREHPDGSGWLQQIPIPKTALTGSWKTYTFDLKIPASTDIYTTRFRIVLKPEMNYTYNLGYYYDNIQAEVLAQNITPSTQPSIGNNAYVVAKGTQDAAKTGYPQMSVVYALNGVEQKILIDKRVVTATYANYEFSTEGLDLVKGKIRVKFTNDNGDRNLYIDKLLIDEKIYQTEAHHTWSTGTWDSEVGCNNNRGGYSWSEGLHCNGYLEYNTIEPQALNVLRTPITAKVHTDKKVELNWEYINALNIKYEILGCDGEKCQPDNLLENNYKKETDVSTHVDIRQWDGIKPKRYMLKVYQSDVLIKKSNVIDLPLPILPPPPVVDLPQGDNLSQVVLDAAGENFFYRSCNMDKSKAEGVDFTKCNNFTYQDEVWTKHSVKSLNIVNADLVTSKLRSLDIDHRIGRYENDTLTKNILYYTALSQDGKTVYTRSCDILDNQDVASCTDWTFTETNKVVPTNLIAQSIENTTYFRDGKYRTLTRVTDSSTQYKFFSRECVTYPVETGTDSCSAWKENNRESSMDNYLGMDSYVFETSNGKKIKESYLTRFLGSIENYLCDFNSSSTTPFEKCGSQTNSSSIEDLQIPITHGSEASLEEAASTSTFVSDLNRLDLPAECRNIKLNSNYDDPYPGNRIQVQTMLNTRVPFNEGVFHTLHFFIPNQLEVPTDIGANPNPACTFAKTEAGDKYTCNLTGGALILNLKVKDNVTIGTPITVNSRVVSSGLTTDCPAYTFNVIQKPTTTPSPSITPTPLTITALTCRKVQELPSKLWTGEQVKYKVVLNDLAPGPDGTVVVRDDLSEKMELVSKPKYCELKTQEVQSAVLGISDVYTSRGSVLFSFILFSILSGGVTYYILYKNKDSITNSTLKEKPYLGGLVIAGVVLLIGGFYFLMTKEDVSPGDTPALISGSYLECKVPEGVKRIAYVMKIKGKKGDVITNTAEVQTGTNTKINTCTSDFKVTGPDVTSSNTPTPIQSPTPTPEYSPTPTPEVESSPTPTPEVESSPTPTPEVESSPTPTPEIDSSPTPTLADEASPTPTVVVGFICGPADVNGDGWFNIYDFGGYQVGFASYYQKLCDDTEADHISYGECGGKDVDKLGKVDIVDFQSFAQRYNKASCAL